MIERKGRWCYRLAVAAAFIGIWTVGTLPHASADTVCDPTNVSHCLKPNSDGSVNTSVTGAGNASVGSNGSAAPGSSTQVGTGSTLQPVSPSNPFATQDAASGTGGSAAPSKAMQAGYSDGTNEQIVSPTHPLPVYQPPPTPASSAGWSTATGTNSATATTLDSNPGLLVSIVLHNGANAAASWCQFFNLASGSVTLGTTSPTNSFEVPASGDANYSLPLPGTFYGTAISIACTTTRAGSSAPANAVGYNIFYK